MARPSKYREEFAAEAHRLCLLGLTDADLAEWFDVSEQTINAWKVKHPEFLESLKSGREPADGRVAASLYRRALGYVAVEEKAMLVDGEVRVVKLRKHVPPNTAACIYWLKNRQRARWRDRVEPEQPMSHEQALEELTRDVEMAEVRSKLLEGIDVTAIDGDLAEGR